MRATFIVAALLPGLALAEYAAQAANALFARQNSVELPCSAQGEKDCGSGCIPLSYTCCPDRAGGCPASEYCDLTANGKYGCCSLGRTCRGNGGAITRPGETLTSVTTITSQTAFTSTSATTVTNLETFPTVAPSSPLPPTTAPLPPVEPTTAPAPPVVPTTTPVAPVAPTYNATVPAPPSPSVPIFTGGSEHSFGSFSKLQLGVAAVGQLIAAWIVL